MTEWLSLTDEQRRTTLEQASVRSGIQAKAIEKDWWVTLCLKALFSSEYAQYCIFKGGTSLSKGWKLIQRLSEDIDIALDPNAFGMEYISLPSHSYVKKLKRNGCVFTSSKMKAALKKTFSDLGLPEEAITIEHEPIPEGMPDKDPQTLFIRYTSLYDPHPYLADEIKIEFGVRSLKEPFATIAVQSLLSEFFPNVAYAEIPFQVIAVEPRKTLLEKVFLLHEKFTYDYPHSAHDDRQSRHLYDLGQLMDTGVGQAALADTDLYFALTEHRRYYVRLSGVDYDSLTPKRVSFVPPIELLDFFKNDYDEMQRSMIYGDSHTFDELIYRLKLLNGRFRLSGTGLVLENIISLAMAQKNPDLYDSKVSIVKVLTELHNERGELMKFRVTMHRHSSGLVFEKIDVIEG